MKESLRLIAATTILRREKYPMAIAGTEQRQPYLIYPFAVYEPR